MKFQLAAGPTGLPSTPSNLLETSESNHGTLTESQKQVDGMVESFVDQATDGRSLAAMVAGGMTYRLGRMGVMATGAGRLASVGIGLGAEVTAYEMTNRSLSSLTGDTRSNPNLWRLDGNGGIRQGLLSSLITFGTLKGAGRLAQGENVVIQHLLQDTGMVLGHQVSGAFGITPRPTGTLAEQFLHAEVTNLQLGAGMAWGHALTGGQLHTIEKGLDLSLRTTEEVSGDQPRFEPFSPALAGGPIQRSAHLTGGEKPFRLPDWLASQGDEKDSKAKEGEHTPSSKAQTEEAKDRFKFLAENPTEATLEDVEALIQEIQNNRAHPEKFGPPLNTLMLIGHSLDETEAHQPIYDKIFEYEDKWLEAGIEEIDSLSEAIQRAKARGGDFTHLSALLGLIAEDHPNQTAREHAWMRFTDPQLLWEKIDRAFEKDEFLRAKECAGFLVKIAVLRRDNDLMEKLLMFPHILVRMEVYKYFSDEMEDDAQKSLAFQNFWVVEGDLIGEDLRSGNVGQIYSAIDTLRLFFRHGVAEAKSILMKLPKSWLEQYEAARSTLELEVPKSPRTSKQENAIEEAYKIAMRLKDDTELPYGEKLIRDRGERRVAVKALEKIIPILSYQDRLFLARLIEGNLVIDHRDVQWWSIQALEKIIPHLEEPQERLARVLEIEKKLVSEYDVPWSAADTILEAIPLIPPPDRLARALKLGKTLLNDDYDYIDIHAAEALREIIPKLPTQDRLELALMIVEALGKDKAEEKEEEFLKDMKDKEDAEILRSLSRRVPNRTVSALVEVFSELPTQDHFSLILMIEKRLGDKNNKVRRDAIQALGEIIPQLETKDPLPWALKITERIGDSDDQVCITAIQALGEIVPHIEVKDRLTLALEFEERLAIWMADTRNRTLRRISTDLEGGDLKVGDLLRGDLKVFLVNPDVRLAAIETLRGFILHLEVKDRLPLALKIEERLGKTSEHARRAAVHELGWIIPHLDAKDRWPLALKFEERLGDPNEGVRRAAYDALRWIIHHLEIKDRLSLALKFEKRLEDPNGGVREDAIYALGMIIPHLEMKDRGVLALKLEEYMGDPNEDVRQAAIIGLGWIIPHLEVKDRLSWALKIEENLADSDSKACTAASKALGEITPQLEEKDRLILALKIEERLGDSDSHLAALFALGKVIPHLEAKDRLPWALKLVPLLGRFGSTVHATLEKIFSHLEAEDRLTLALKIEEGLGDPDYWVRGIYYYALVVIVPHLEKKDRLILALKIKERLPDLDSPFLSYEDEHVINAFSFVTSDLDEKDLLVLTLKSKDGEAGPSKKN